MGTPSVVLGGNLLMRRIAIATLGLVHVFNVPSGLNRDRHLRRSWRLRSALALVALLTSISAIDAAGAAGPSKWPPPRCPAARALVANYVSDGFSFNNERGHSARSARLVVLGTADL